MRATAFGFFCGKTGQKGSLGVHIRVSLAQQMLTLFDDAGEVLRRAGRILNGWFRRPGYRYW